MIRFFIRHFWVCSLLILTSVPHVIAKAGNQFLIAVNGKANAVIIIPGNATLREKFAAEELQKYIKAISGAYLSIKPDTKTVKGNTILIGGPDRNSKARAFISVNDFENIVPGPEGMMIKTFKNSALLLGGSTKTPLEYERGTLYAVYEFLERYLGCSFGAYGKQGVDLGEYIPTTKTVQLDSISYVKARADLTYRGGIVQYTPKRSPNHPLGRLLIDWLAKNRYNRICTMPSAYEAFKKNGLLFEAQKRGLLFSVGHHESSLLFLPPDGNNYFPEKYFTTHPEYYRLQKDGTRFHPNGIWTGQWIFDSRNPEAIKQVAANIKIWLSKNPYVDVVSLWPLDGTSAQCVGPECSKYSKTENYAYFMNEVAKMVKQDYPNVKIDMLVYHDIWKYPAGLKLDPSLLIEHANSTRTYGKNDGRSFIGTDYELNAKNWSQSGATQVYYEYYMGKFAGNQVYFPMADELYNDYNHLKNEGYIKGVATQIECYNLWNFVFNFYTHGRTAYDTSLTLNDNMNRFCSIFGAGKPYIKDYLTYVEGFYEDNGGKYPGKWFALHADKAKVYNFFEKAYDAQPEGKLRDNIRLLRMAFRYSDLYTRSKNLGELGYMYRNFDTYHHYSGYGISIRTAGLGTYTPDKWYKFNQ